MMLNPGWLEWVGIRSVVLLLHCTAPLCTVYTATLARRAVLSVRGPSFEAVAQSILSNPRWPRLTAFQYYCVAETLFFLFYLWYRTFLQREAVHPPLLSKDERKQLFDHVRAEIHDPGKFLSGWFRGARVEDIGREDVKEFLGWVFWEGRNTREDDEEMEGITEEVEAMVGKRFKDGKGGVRSLRLTLDPIEMEWRSLLWYFIIMGVDTVTHIRFMIYGFKYYSTPAASISVFPPRPLASPTATGPSPAKSMSYWLRPHTSKTRLPILYVHGIGVGLHPHVEFLHNLDVALNGRSKAKNESGSEGQVGILAVEILQISSRLTQTIPTRAEFLEQLTQILDLHDFKRFVLLSHSYGSVQSTHMLSDDVMASRVAATLLVDPVTILLHMPDVAYNFTVRKPRHANEWQLWYFASKDPGVSHTLGRHFFWSQNILWRDHIMELVDQGMRMTVSLSSRDLIVDTEAVGKYLVEDVVPDPVLVGDDGTDEKHMELEASGKQAGGEVAGWKERGFQGKGLEVLWWEDFDHAQVFDNKASSAKLVDVLVEYSKGR